MAATIYVDDCREMLRQMPQGSVHCVVTSPPYWSLRDYGLPPLLWGGSAGCEHIWDERVRPVQTGGTGTSSAKQISNHGSQMTDGTMAFCSLCGCWRGSLGLEPTPELYVEHIVEVFREIKRVLRDDGTVWANWGDSYVASRTGNATPGKGLTGGSATQLECQKRPDKKPSGFLKPKDLCGIPWRCAFALQADGWWLRSDIIWHKTNPMPESVRDRPTKAHEYLFLLSKAKRYYYDQEAVREPHAYIDRRTKQGKARLSYGGKGNPESRNFSGGADWLGQHPSGRNRRSVWRLPTQPFKGAHFATFPEALVEPCIKAGTSERGCCPSCGAGWARVVERTEGPNQEWAQDVNPTAKESALIKSGTRCGHGKLNRGSKADYYANAARNITIGWRPGCACSGLVIIGDQPSKPSRKQGQSELSYITDVTAWEIRLNKWREQWESLKPLYDSEKLVPAVCMDPFTGSGTVGVVAARLGRHAILCEMNPEYAEMARKRIKDDAPMFNQVEVE